MDRVRTSFAAVRDWWSDLRGGQRAAIIGCLVLAVGVVFVVRAVSQPTYSVLFTELPGEDFNKVVSWLDTKKVPFESRGSDTVLVPQERVITTRAEMAKEGIPTLGHIVGKEDLEQTSFSETRAQFQKRVQRMVEGEVTRTILLFDEVKSAKVNIAFPETEPLFKEDRVPLTAAVSVTMRNPNSELSRSTVDSIAGVVSNSVSDLAPERVTIVDSRGRRYHSQGQTDGLDATQIAAQANERRDQETELEEELQAGIGKVVGSNNVRVVASIELEWANESTKRKELLPDPETRKPFIVSDQSKEEAYTGPGVTGGVPGVEPNVAAPPEGAPPTYPVTAGGNINYSNAEKTRNYDYGILETDRKSLSPKTTRKSVGIFLNESTVSAGEQAKIQETASAQAGIDLTRGDVLVVQRVPFEEQPALEAPKVSAFSRMLVPAIVALCGLFIPIVLSRMAAPPKPKPVEEPEEEELLPEEPPPPSPESWDGLFEEPALSEDDLIRQETLKRSEATFESVRRTAEERPEDFAAALRAWLVDE